jgi:hypothetical protein
MRNPIVLKKDNANIHHKLALRRYFLDQYRDEPYDVFDCCQGSKLIWGKLIDEYKITQYWGVDLKKKRGRLMVDSVRILAQKHWTWNVIDVDTYGTPWKHYAEIIANATKPVTVFLTIGNQNQTAMKGAAHGEKELNFGFPDRTPDSIKGQICRRLDVTVGLSIASQYGKIIEAKEALAGMQSHGPAAKYIGLRFEPYGND